MNTTLIVITWSALIAVIVLAVRCAHLAAVNRKLNWMLTNQGKVLDIEMNNTTMLMETIADQSIDISRFKKLAFDWESVYLKLARDIAKAHPDFEIDLINLKSE